MSLKLFLVLRSSPHEVCFHFVAPGFAATFFRHFEATLQPEEAQRYSLHERLCFIFAPLAFTNSKALEEAPDFFCRALELDDDHSVLCSIVDEFHLFAVYFNRHYSESYLTHHFESVRDLFGAFLGPCWFLLMPSRNRVPHEAFQRLLQAMLEELLWLESAEFQQQFGAIEHLGVRHELKAAAVTALESACARLNRRMKGSRNGMIRHSLLLAGTKLLALYSASGAPDLPPRDVLLVSVLVRALYQRSEPNTEVYETCRDTVSEEEPFFSPQEEPGMQQRDRAISTLLDDVQWEAITAKCESQTEAEGDEENGEAEDEAEEEAEEEREDNTRGGTPSDVSLQSDRPAGATRGHCPVSAEGSLEPVVQEVATSDDRTDYRHVRLLLGSGPSERGTHSLHVVRLSKQLVAVFFQESPEMALSVKMAKATELCRRQRQKENEQMRPLLRICAEVSARLAELFGSDLHDCRRLDELRTELSRAESVPPSDETESVLPDLLEQLQGCLAIIFGKLFLRLPWALSQNVTDVIASSARQLQARLSDCIGFLDVKAVRNLAPTSFTSSMPGMVHFVWVDREHQRLITPTLDADTLSGEQAERIHHRAEFCRELQRQTRHLEVFCKDSVFQYSFRVIGRARAQWSGANDSGEPVRLEAPNFELFVVHFAYVTRDCVRRHVTKILKNFMHHNDDVNSTLGLLT